MKDLTRRAALVALAGGVAGAIVIAPAVSASVPVPSLTEEQVAEFLRGYDNEENLPLHLAAWKFKQTEKLENEWDAGIFAPPCPPAQQAKEPEPITPEEAPIDTTGNPFVLPGTYAAEVSEAEFDLVEFLQKGALPVHYYDTPSGQADKSDPEAEYTPEEEAESRAQWLQAHRAQAQRLRAYIERFS